MKKFYNALYKQQLGIVILIVVAVLLVSAPVLKAQTLIDKLPITNGSVNAIVKNNSTNTEYRYENENYFHESILADILPKFAEKYFWSKK